ncbi:MAG: PhnD/SsuA/transferrin family substrate-binding protein, partial [Oscillibacter sp.]|nr:PhnD/SsuA/transferrin family substrate-binding protein [Oscillibacter sp.]
MKKICALLLCGILLLLAAGCGKKTPAASSPAGSSAGETPPAAVGELTVELPRELDTKAARAAMEKLPELLGRSGVDVTSVTLTFGTSYAATASALDSGAVRLAFLPADVFAGLCKTAVPVLADAGQAFSAGDDPASWNSGPAKRNGGLCAGTAALICAAPTEYGQNLAGRAAKGKSFTWAELEHARWGVLDRESTAGYRCVELWLEDNYEGRGLGELPSVTFYAGWEELFRAAAEGEIDLLPAAPEQRERFAAAW